MALFEDLHSAAEASGFSGVIRVDVDGALVDERAYGLSDRAHGIPAETSTRFGLASISKAFTALTIGSLLDEGALALGDRVRPLLGTDLPLIDDAVTIDHLLTHRSGIGDYLDESDGEITDYVLDLPVHTLEDTESFLPLLDGRAQVGDPGAAFVYNNSGFVILALLAERVCRRPFHELVGERVFAPAGMVQSGYPRSDEPTGDLAVGYLADSGPRTNLLHLPVRGSGDGGAVSSVSDLAGFWRALMSGAIVSPSTLDALLEPVSEVAEEGMRYGRGFWRGLRSELVILEGYDAGVSGRTWYDPESRVAASVISNTSDGAWPVLRALSWS